MADWQKCGAQLREFVCHKHFGHDEVHYDEIEDTYFWLHFQQ